MFGGPADPAAPNRLQAVPQDGTPPALGAGQGHGHGRPAQGQRTMTSSEPMTSRSQYGPGIPVRPPAREDGRKPSRGMTLYDAAKLVTARALIVPQQNILPSVTTAVYTMHSVKHCFIGNVQHLFVHNPSVCLPQLISQLHLQQHSLRRIDRQKTEITKVRHATFLQLLRGPNTPTARASMDINTEYYQVRTVPSNHVAEYCRE